MRMIRICGAKIIPYNFGPCQGFLRLFFAMVAIDFFNQKFAGVAVLGV